MELHNAINVNNHFMLFIFNSTSQLQFTSFFFVHFGLQCFHIYDDRWMLIKLVLLFIIYFLTIRRTARQFKLNATRFSIFTPRRLDNNWRYEWSWISWFTQENWLKSEYEQNISSASVDRELFFPRVFCLFSVLTSFRVLRRCCAVMET